MFGIIAREKRGASMRRDEARKSERTRSMFSTILLPSPARGGVEVSKNRKMQAAFWTAWTRTLASFLYDRLTQRNRRKRYF